jgi:hypothetical protein
MSKTTTNAATGTAKPLNQPPLPRALVTKDAAIYVAASSPRQFRNEVKRGLWPQPISPFSKPHRWSVVQLDKALDGDLRSSLPKPNTLDKRFNIQ